MKIALFALGEKGYRAIKAIPKPFSSSIQKVIIGTDSHVTDDYSSQLKTLCEERGYAWSFDSKDVNDSIYLIAMGWRHMISSEAHQKIIVLHDSILPRYRGFNPLVTALVNGDTEIGVTALFGVESYDEGDIIDVETMTVAYPITIATAIDKMSDCYAVLLLRVLEKLNANTLTSEPQDASKVTYSLWRDAEDYFIDWSWDSEKILRFIHAVGTPYAGAKSRVQSKTYTIVDASLREDVLIENRTPGKVVFKDEGKPVVVCGSGLLRLDAVLKEDGGKETFDNKFRLRFQ